MEDAAESGTRFVKDDGVDAAVADDAAADDDGGHTFGNDPVTGKNGISDSCKMGAAAPRGRRHNAVMAKANDGEE
jgi:hypothetical protein